MRITILGDFFQKKTFRLAVNQTFGRFPAP
jgi:hypothetical protein